MNGKTNLSYDRGRRRMIGALPQTLENRSDTARRWRYRDVILSGWLCCGLFPLQTAYATLQAGAHQAAAKIPAETPIMLQLVQGGPQGIRVSNVDGQAGEPLPVKIELVGPADRDAGNLFIFSGIPQGITLKPGGNFGQFWAVNSKVFNQLTLTAQKGMSGSFTVKVTQTGTSPDDQKRSSTFSVVIRSPKSTTQQETVASVERFPETRQRTQPLQLQRQEPNLRDSTLMQRATKLFSMGDISGARTVFQYLAARGNAQAAIALGGTYDPLILGQLHIKGMEPDLSKARKWYQHAEKLGSPEAGNRLAALSQY